MLFDINGKRVNRNPHAEEFATWRAGVSDTDFQAMEQAGFFFGNIVRRVLDDRADRWRFAGSCKEDDQPFGKFYWRERS